MLFGNQVKHQLKRTVRGITLIAPAGPDTNKGARILTYHSVGRRDHEMNVTVDNFREQMRWLKGNYPVCSLSDAATKHRGVAITFDDGYCDNLENAAPILEELGIPATVFIVAGRVGMHLGHDADSASSALMTWEEVREIESAGWEIGGHTLTHRRLSECAPSEQQTEIEVCTELLRDNLGHSIESFAYPFGSSLDYNEVSKAVVRRCGYRFALSNRYGAHMPTADPWSIRRIWVDRTDSLDSFKAKVDGSLDALTWLDSPLGIRARRALNDLLRTA